MARQDDPILIQLNRELAELERQRKRFETMVPNDAGTYSSASREHALKVSDELVLAKKLEIYNRKKELDGS